MDIRIREMVLGRWTEERRWLLYLAANGILFYRMSTNYVFMTGMDRGKIES